MQEDWLLSGPQNWFRLLDKHVRVEVGSKEEHVGWLLTVDPVSASVVLVNFSKDRASVRVLMGHAVKAVEVLQEPDPETADRLHSFFRPLTTPILDPEELRRRRTRVHEWLEKNRLPVDEDRDKLRVAGVLTIAAPYRPEDCCSSNQIILDRIQKLIQVHLEADPDQTERQVTETSLDLDPN